MAYETTALIEAIPHEDYNGKKGSIECVKLLLDAGADVDARRSYYDGHDEYYEYEEYGSTALIEAIPHEYTETEANNIDIDIDIKKGSVECVRLLLDAGADVNVKAKVKYDDYSYESYETTALIQAIPYKDYYGRERGSIECVKLLLGAGANAKEKNKYGDTALIKAAGSGSIECYKLLLDAGANPNDVPLSSIISQIEYSRWRRDGLERMAIDCVQDFLSAGANVNAKGEYDGTTVLIETVEHGFTKLARLLLDAGADVNAKDNYGNTALMAAIPHEDYNGKKGSAECVKLLLDAGADVNAKDNYGNTALIQAATSGSAECVRLLLDAGADVNANHYGSTALLKAATSGSAECVRLLLDAGADVDARDKAGKTAFDHAGKEEVKALLQKAREDRR